MSVKFVLHGPNLGVLLQPCRSCQSRCSAAPRHSTLTSHLGNQHWVVFTPLPGLRFSFDQTNLHSIAPAKLGQHYQICPFPFSGFSKEKNIPVPPAYFHTTTSVMASDPPPPRLSKAYVLGLSSKPWKDPPKPPALNSWKGMVRHSSCTSIYGRKLIQ